MKQCATQQAGYEGTEGVVQASHLVLCLSRESELVLGLSVGNLVDTEPFIGRADKTRQMTFNILDVIQLRGERVVDIDDEDFPVLSAP